MKTILLVFGTRPEAIKMAPLQRLLQQQTGDIVVKTCVTAQHREMLDSVLKLFGITPDYDLNLMRPGQNLYTLTADILLAMQRVLQECHPDMVLVHGDTTTAFAAGLAAFYQQIPVGHVEAGLRTYRKYAPFPEEINRQLVDRIATYFFAPTEQARQNLLKEGVKPEKIAVTGNTVIDALHLMLHQLQQDTAMQNSTLHTLKIQGYCPGSRRFVLITGHRRENFGKGFLEICAAINQLAELHPETDFVYPVHLNPNVSAPVHRLLAHQPNIFLLPPLDYGPFVMLMSRATLVLTDSGGIQEEAPSLGIPVLVMRDTTERPEAVKAGTVLLVGAEKARIVQHTHQLLTDEKAYHSMSKSLNPYGDGTASAQIINFLKQQL